MALTESIFDTIANAKTSGGGNRIADGSYTFMVKNLLLEEKRGGVTFIAEFYVISAAPVPLVAGLLNDGEVAGLSIPNPVGSSGSYVVVMNNDSAPGNIKAFVEGLDGTPNMDPAKFKATLKQATGGNQPMRGALVKGDTYRKTIKGGPNAGKPFTGWNWHTVHGQTAETIAQGKAKLEALASAAASA